MSAAPHLRLAYVRPDATRDRRAAIARQQCAAAGELEQMAIRSIMFASAWTRVWIRAVWGV